RGDAGYLADADLDGDGFINAADRQILDGNAGFVAGRSLPAAEVPLTLDLDPASDTAPAGDGRTFLDRVTLVGHTTPAAAVGLAPAGATATADGDGVFAFFDVALAVGAN